MGYFSLAHRVPEISALEPRLVTRFYALIGQMPLVRTTHRRFIAGVLSQGLTHGVGLDLGAGPGYVVMELSRRRPALKMAGLDLSAEMVEQAIRRAARAGLDGKGLWLQADGHRLPFTDHSLDLVVSSFALHHWDDPLHTLNEIARVLKPDGGYYIADVCRQVNLFQRFFAYASIPAISLPLGSYRGYGGYYESVRAGYTRAEAQNLLQRSALPPGKVGLDSTWFVSILTISSASPSPG